MKFVQSLAAVSAAMVLVVGGSLPAAAEPRPDNRSDAGTVAMGDTVTMNTSGATLEAGEAAPCGADTGSVWFSLQMDEPGPIQVDTIGSDYDTTLAIFADHDAVACNDNESVRYNVLTSRTEVDADAGSYLIRVGSVGQGGNLRLHILGGGKFGSDVGVSNRDIKFGVSDGRAVLTGWANCTRPMYVVIDISELSQALPGNATGSARNLVFACEGNTDLTITVLPSAGRFIPGNAKLVETGYGCVNDSCLGFGGTWEAEILLPEV